MYFYPSSYFTTIQDGTTLNRTNTIKKKRPCSDDLLLVRTEFRNLFLTVFIARSRSTPLLSDAVARNAHRGQAFFYSRSSPIKLSLCPSFAPFTVRSDRSS